MTNRFQDYSNVLFLLILCFVSGCRITTQQFATSTVEITAQPEPMGTSTIEATSVSIVDTLPIYFIAHENLSFQIWKKSQELSKLYEIIQDINTPFDKSLPMTEVQLLQKIINNLSIKPDILHNLSMTNLALSPTKKELSWLEIETYCIKEHNRCFGVSKLRVLDLQTKISRTLFETPHHHSSTLNAQSITYGPIWSPNGQYVSITHSIEQLESTAHIIDVGTGQVQKFVGAFDSSIPLIWSQDSSRIGWFAGHSIEKLGIQFYERYIQFCRLETAICENIELSKREAWGLSLDWSPDGEKFAYSIKKGDSTELYILNIETNTPQRIPIDMEGVFENPKWSPNSKLLVIEYRSKLDDFLDSLIIVEPISGKVINELSAEHFRSDWVWGSESNTILVNGASTADFGLGVFDIYTGILTPITLSEDLSTQQISHPNW